jgi:tRNA-uridine 2-sulfurtransferase
MKVAVGLSGGVDSAVSAALLKEQGYEVTGVFIICYHGPGCRTDEDRKDALDVALKLDIPFEVLDFRKDYQEKVLEYFRAEYQAGRTPNPDVVCNREIKFGLFYQWALDHGFDYVATGHYARIVPSAGCQVPNQNNLVPGTWHSELCLCRSVDEHKDQTYFLYQLREEQLEHILFPIGGMTKQRVREVAIKRDLPVAKKPDSQGICFVGEVGVREFLMKMGVGGKEGEVIRFKPHQTSPLTKGEAGGVRNEVIGTHKGVWFYTIGQRHGFEIKAKTNQASVYYVVEKNIEKNQLIVGTREECMRGEFEVCETKWINMYQVPSAGCQVRIRHGGELIKIKRIIEQANNRLILDLEKPLFGVAAGQVAVFYQDQECLGGGVIC